MRSDIDGASPPSPTPPHSKATLGPKLSSLQVGTYEAARSPVFEAGAYPELCKWLEAVKPGYARFAAAFAVAGYEDIADLKVDLPTAEQLRQLLAGITAAKSPQIQHILHALNLLSADGEESSGGNPQPHRADARNTRTAGGRPLPRAVPSSSTRVIGQSSTSEVVRVDNHRSHGGAGPLVGSGVDNGTSSSISLNGGTADGTFNHVGGPLSSASSAQPQSVLPRSSSLAAALSAGGQGVARGGAIRIPGGKHVF